MNSQILPVRSLEALLKRRVAAVDLEALATIEPIVASVRADGEQALRASAERFGDLSEHGELWLGPPQLRRSLESLLPEERRRLERVAERIVAFARLQRASIVDTELALSGGRAGQRLAPIFAVGCYAPGGRHPLPSTVLMTALTARVAGVPNVVLASPRPTPLTRAAAAHTPARANAAPRQQHLASHHPTCKSINKCNTGTGNTGIRTHPFVVRSSNHERTSTVPAQLPGNCPLARPASRIGR